MSKQESKPYNATVAQGGLLGTKEYLQRMVSIGLTTNQAEALALELARRSEWEKSASETEGAENK